MCSFYSISDGEEDEQHQKLVGFASGAKINNRRMENISSREAAEVQFRIE